MVRYSISNTTSGRTLFRGMALVLFISLVSCIQGYAQTEKESLSHGANGIFEALSAQREGQGTIDITQPEDIKNQVGLVHQKQARHSEGERSGVHTQQGFRIQAYTGNLAKSKDEAYRRAKVVNAANPALGCYVTYKSPCWRLSVGDFRTREEAQKAMQDLKRAIPAIAPELYIVRDNIRVSN